MPSNRILVNNLIKGGHLKTKRIVDAFEKIDRKDFVPEELQHKAYVNEPLPIGFGQTISQPQTVAFMLELLNPQPGERILEVGAGSGWKTSLLAHIVGVEPEFGKRDEPREPGHVVAIERIRQLYEKAAQNVSRYGFMKKGVVSLVHGDGTKGHIRKAPFDKIIAGAAGSIVPAAWKSQVRVGGIIVVPIEDMIKVMEKKSPIDFRVRDYFGFRFVPLITNDGGGN